MNWKRHEVRKDANGKVVCEYGMTSPKEGAEWSGEGIIPAIGDEVSIGMNKLGKGTVVGYFVEHGWQGVYVSLHNPPKWWIKQNGADCKDAAMVFGAEV